MDDYEFQVGDIVRILSKDEHHGDVYFGWDDDMEKWANQCFVISEIENESIDNTFIYFEDMSDEMRCYSWGTDMIELVCSINSAKISEEDKKEWNNFFHDV